MAGKITAVDRGSHGTRVISVREGKHGLELVRFAAFPSADSAAGLRQCGIPLKGAVCGLAGRDMTLRYTQVPPSPDWQLQNLMELEIQDMAAQTGGELSADFNLLPIEDEGGMDTVLLAFARNEALDRVGGEVAAAGGSVAGHVPNCVALYNAYLRCGPVDEESTTCLVNLGHETTDIAIVRGVDLLFVRNLQSGGKVFDDAIAAAFNVKERKAQELKKELLDLSPFSRGRYASGQAEKVTMAAGGAGSAIVAAIQSSLAFCRNQTKIQDLQLDRLLICGGSAKVRGIEGMLREALRTPVERFDPFANVDLASLPAGDVELLERYRAEAVVALGLAVSELDDELYELRILPEAVRRRRNFAQRTVYNIGAIVVGVLLLLLSAMTERTRAEAAETTLGRIRQTKARAEAVHDATEKMVEANQRTHELVDFLAERAIAHDGVVLVLRALQQTMPPECWLESLEVRRTAPPDATRSTAADRKPMVVFRGRAKGVLGRDVGDVYQQFVREFRALVPSVWTKPTHSGGETQFEFTVDFRPDPETKQD